ncbi:MAG: class I SAM-dependent methyltransferase [Ignavibacteria bacterium]|nr:class I SAM-dependent methyltransferase [Ignavibacteria bacterium]
MHIITLGDFIDSYIKIKQKGIKFLINRIKKNKWNEINNIKINSAVWEIPFFIKQRNKIITKNENIEYPEYFCKKYLSDKNELKLLSVGSGTGYYEREFAKQKLFSKIIGIELATNRFLEAQRLADIEKLNIQYLNQNIYEANFDEKFDVVLFNSSLHHFSNINGFISNKIKPLMNKSGYLIICEYVGKNRLFIPKFQLAAINNLMENVPIKYRKYASINSYKNKIYSPGLLRMLLSDASEAVDSDAIIPSLHEHFRVLEEKQLGWNLLMPLLKDIAHNFMIEDEQTLAVLQYLHIAEERFVVKNKCSDYIFGVYSF